MTQKTRAMVLLGPSRLEMQEFELPAIGDEDGLLKVELAGVCGSDPGIYEGKSSRGPRPYPLILGHEVVGRVYKMGKSAQSRRGMQEGDRVIMEYAFSCGQCEPCLEGRYTLCKKNYTYGSMISCKEPPHLFGAYSDFVYIHPRAMVHKIGDEISPEVGVLICAVLGNGVRWLRHVGNVSIGQSVAIVGPGQQGLAGVIVAKESGASPIMVLGLERDQKRLAMAKRMGADLTIVVDREDPVEAVSRATEGRMAELVMDVTGHPSGAELGLSLCGTGATFVLPGIYKAKKASLNLDLAVINEIKLLGVYSQNFKAVRPAISLARTNRYPLQELITHRFPLEDAEKAIHLVGGKVEGEMPLKVVLDPSMK